MTEQRHRDYCGLVAGVLALLFFCTIPTVFVAIAHDKLRASPVQMCVDESGHFERECP